jgi:hypothetical protein
MGFNNPQVTHCVPTFILIGSMKAGTTALFSYLLDNPTFNSPMNKEVHWFDQRRLFNRGLPWYLDRFPELKSTAAAEKTLTGDDTPAYAATASAVARVMQGLGDVARDEMRFVWMLRNPTDRAYSEYQMHMRRFHSEQNGWATMVAAWPTIRKCMEEKRKVKVAINALRDFEHVPGQGQCFLEHIPKNQMAHKLATQVLPIHYTLTPMHHTHSSLRRSVRRSMPSATWRTRRRRTNATRSLYHRHDRWLGPARCCRWR